MSVNEMFWMMFDKVVCGTYSGMVQMQCSLRRIITPLMTTL